MVTPLEYGAGLNLQQAEERLKEVRTAFEEVQARYSARFGRFKLNMCEDDKTTLTDCVGVLLPLGLENCIQEQIIAAPENEESLFSKIGDLNTQILFYLADFKNTGVKRAYGSLLD